MRGVANEKLAQASEFLSRYLRFGPRPPAEIKEDALQHGVKWMTVRRAAEEIGVIRRNLGPKSVWELPTQLLNLLNEGDE